MRRAVPIVSALVLLLTSVAMGRVALGLTLLLAFSAGLAVILTAVGLAVLYASFGLFAPRTSVTVVALFLSALAVSMAFKLVLDLDSPFAGGIHVTPPPIHISGEPLREALQVIRK